MGVSDFFFKKKNLSKQITVGNKQMMAITSPKVLAYAKEYFGCDSIEGVPLENGGGSGSKNSHWEKTLFPSEVMNPQVAYPATISMFTIKLLEDMGWYKGVNAAQKYTYLKGDGCGSIKRMECNAKNSEEFCAPADYNKEHCYPNKLGKGHCGSSGTFMGQCRYIAPRMNAMCTQEMIQIIKALILRIMVHIQGVLWLPKTVVIMQLVLLQDVRIIKLNSNLEQKFLFAHQKVNTKLT